MGTTGQRPSQGVSPDKLILFSLSNIVGGLLQLWVLFLVLMALGQAPQLGVLLGDGGLFFFSTALIFNSLLMLLGAPPPALLPKGADYVVTALAALVLITVVAIYTSVLTQHLGEPSPFGGQAKLQIAFALVALVYAFYVAARAGQFGK